MGGGATTNIETTTSSTIPRYISPHITKQRKVMAISESPYKPSKKINTFKEYGMNHGIGIGLIYTNGTERLN